jgi:hypothetical protein
MFSAEQLNVAVDGVSFPARRWQLVAWADWNCASSALREALRHVPDQVYVSPGQLMELFDAAERREASVDRDFSRAGVFA